jgi:broad specificity phosphatase PhoE
VLTRQAFWFLRHGETDWNAEGLSQGNVDIPLNARGVAQAQAAAELLRGRGIRSLVASPLSRARDTAAVVGDALGLAVEVEPELREVAFGAQEGQPMGDWYDDWIAGGFTPPGAETFAALRARATAAANRALQREPPVLVVAHGALFRALRAEMGLSAGVRTPNAVPLLCTPGTPGESWALTAATH